MKITPPSSLDFGFYNGYVSNATHTDLITALNDSWEDVYNTVSTLSDEQLESRYEAGKWSIKEVIAHLVDAERTFCIRIQRFSRKDQAPLPPIDMHAFVANAHANNRDIKDILHELHLLRQASILMFKGMDETMLELTGPARDITISVRALGFAMAGHNTHHIQIIKERYLQLV